jgi:large subunit ribosomal protein L4
MATLNIIDSKGAKSGTLDVSDAVFAVEPNKNAVRQSLLAFEANQRQGTHATKTRGQVRGGGRKPFRQKGTGRARQGSIRAAQCRGGSIIFGPSPRDYYTKVNRKVRRLALYSALSDLRNQDRIRVVKSFDLTAPKTAKFAEILEGIGVAEDVKVVILTAQEDENLLLSARNLPNVLVSPVHNINIYCLLMCDCLVATPEAVKQLEELIA